MKIEIEFVQPYFSVQRALRAISLTQEKASHIGREIYLQL